jgi:hypothetical protein
MEARAPGASVVARAKEKLFRLPFDVVGSDCLLKGGYPAPGGRTIAIRAFCKCVVLGENESHGAPTPGYVRDR